MAWSITSVAQATPGTSSPITVTYSGIAGRLYLLCASRDAAGDPYTSVTDNASNTWNNELFVPPSGTTGRRTELWACIPTSSFAEISLAFTGASFAQATLLEVTGHHATYLDQIDGGVRSATTTPEGFTVTPSVDDSLILAMIQANNNTNAQISGPSGSWTRLSTNSRGPAIAYRTDIANGDPVTASWTLTNSVGSGHIIASFAPSTDTPPTGPAVTVFDGTDELPAHIEGVWDGSVVNPAAFEQIS